ncbi:MAG: cell division protein FtsQ/DivIB [Halothiobacillaceae bacterium]
MAAVYAKRPGTPIATRIAAWPWAAMARHTLHLLVLAGMVWAIVWGWRAIHDPWNFPLRVVKVDGELQHLKPQAVQTAVDERLQGSFFGVDLPIVLRGLTDLAWIKDARVRREWPDKLHLWVEEHKPLALWRGDAVLTADGSLIYPEGKREDDQKLSKLPALSGADGREMALWNELNRLGGLLEPTGLRVVALREDQRGSQTLLLEHGLSLRLGREDVEKRLQRFLAVFPKTLAGRIGEVEEVDLRYANGFSVRMRAPVDGKALSKVLENRMLATEGTENTEGERGLRVVNVGINPRAIPHGLGHFISESSVFSVANMDFKTYTRHRGDSTLVATISTALTGKKNGQKVG